MTKLFQLKASKLGAMTGKLIWLGVFVCAASSVQASEVRWLQSPLAGTDADYDGVRDDVEKIITERHSSASRRHWSMDMARATQRHVVSDGNAFAIYRAEAEMLRAMRCLGNILPTDEVQKVRDEVLQLVLNTPERLRAYNRSRRLWDNDIRHRDLPARPDDKWQESCGKHRSRRQRPATEAQAIPVKHPRPAAVAPKPAPSAAGKLRVDKMKNLPAPNFFIVGEMPVKPFKTPKAVPAPRPEKEKEISKPATGIESFERDQDETVMPPAANNINQPIARPSASASGVDDKPQPAEKMPGKVSEVDVPEQRVVQPLPMVVNEPELRPRPDSKPTDGVKKGEDTESSELVIVVQKASGGDGALIGPAATPSPTIQAYPEDATLPSFLLELAPYIKSFKYQPVAE